MAKRCPGAIALGGAVLLNHRLAERLYADIDFVSGATAEGVLYLISEANLARLDAYEGNTSVKVELIEIPIADWAAVDRLEGYPDFTTASSFPCTLADGTTDTGWIYIMNALPPMATVIKSGDWKGYRHG